MNWLYYGDNLQVLRDHIADESVDLIYLDPPFNSKRDYNLLCGLPELNSKSLSQSMEPSALQKSPMNCSVNRLRAFEYSTANS